MALDDRQETLKRTHLQLPLIRRFSGSVHRNNGYQAFWRGINSQNQTIYTMNWLTKLFSKKSSNQLVIKFSKQDNLWLVMKGYDILYIGDEPQCNAYIWNHISK